MKSHTDLLVPAKLPRVVAYLPEDIKADLEMLAANERRSLSQYAAMILENAVKQARAEGKLEKQEDL